jgi:hypothetical protein
MYMYMVPKQTHFSAEVTAFCKKKKIKTTEALYRRMCQGTDFPEFFFPRSLPAVVRCDEAGSALSFLQCMKKSAPQWLGVVNVLGTDVSELGDEAGSATDFLQCVKVCCKYA